MMNIVITGADGFIGKNLRARLSESTGLHVTCILRTTPRADMDIALMGADYVFHLAGVNRPQAPADFWTGNKELTEQVCSVLLSAQKKATVILASSTQADLQNPYGQSKRAAEEVVKAYSATSGARVHIFRLPNVFGKWAKPFYNSVVATFCHSVARGLPITVNDPQASLQLAYVDDVVDTFLACLHDARGVSGVVSAAGIGKEEIQPTYAMSVGALAKTLQDFSKSRTDLIIPRVGEGLLRALYSTYISYLPVEEFSYGVPRHEDSRGIFVEMLKTSDSGQFSYFTAHPGVKRGEHYHHSKVEKFLVIKGVAQFGFRHVLTNETFNVLIKGGEGRIIESIPGWTHNVENVGQDELIVMLWANEVFNRDRPDTFAMKV